MARGLFHRAIGQSGGRFLPMRNLKESGSYSHSAEEVGLVAAESMGVENTDSALERLREVSPESLVQAANAAMRQTGAAPRPNLDGWVFARGVCETFSHREQNDVPLLLGWNRDEGTDLVHPWAPTDIAQYRTEIRDQYGDFAEEFLELYEVEDDEDARRAHFESYTDGEMAWQMLTWSRMARRYGKSLAYLYLFSRVPPGPTAEHYGAYHTAEIFYVFGLLGLGSSPFDPPRVGHHPYEEIDQNLSQMMMSYWVNFASTGDPNGEGLPLWPQYSRQTGELLELGDHVVPRAEIRADYFDFWDRYYGEDCSLLRGRQ